MTIPRLKLMAILIGTRAAQFVMTQLDLVNLLLAWSSWLVQGEISWPKWEHDFDNNNEPKEITIAKVSRMRKDHNLQFIDVGRFSKWLRSLRTTAWILKFIRLTTKSGLSWLQSVSTEKDRLTTEDYKLSEWLLIRQAQSEGVNDDEINKWNLFYTDNKSFKLLPMASLRKRVSTDLACQPCQRCQRMSTRVNRCQPTFAHIGVDYFGPLSIKGNSVPTKKWVILFTCFTTRAMYLELAEDQSAETFLHAIRRFIARRGYPELILSDNATQFQAFRTIMTQVVVSNFLAKGGMTWKNIVPKAPWQGGI
uniref:Integrase catalytic domain-containing protein n=1 Tax=Loa loa TaxID=7209 RepID=A0A1I7VEP8_LOALO